MKFYFLNYKNYICKNLNILFVPNNNYVNDQYIFPSDFVFPISLKKKLKHGEMLDCFLLYKNKLQRFLLCGIIYKNKLTTPLLTYLGAKLIEKINFLKIKNISIFLEFLNKINDSFILDLVEGMMLRNYIFNKFFSSKKNTNMLYLESVFVYATNNTLVNRFKERKHIVFSTHFVRDLITFPANYLTPDRFVKICKNMRNIGLKINVIAKNQLIDFGMNTLLGVAQGSNNMPYIVSIEWQGNITSRKDPLVFVGKGVTFDSGGYNLKPSGRSISLMKYDMGGGAVVIGLLRLLALRNANVNVIGIIGIVENMVSGTAQRPGDVVKSMSGQTIEVDNTDAEGRLVLADLFCYIQTFLKPKLIINIATLTGAIVVALGSNKAGLLSNNNKLANNLLNSSVITGEEIWRFPLNKDYDSLLDSEIANMKNIGGNAAGSVVAAQFLQRFIKKNNCPWAHIDIAATNWLDSDYQLSPKGATGFGVRLLNHFIKQNQEITKKQI